MSNIDATAVSCVTCYRNISAREEQFAKFSVLRHITGIIPHDNNRNT